MIATNIILDYQRLHFHSNWLKLIRHGDSYYTAPSWERTFCTSVCRVPWRKICDANTVLYIYKNVAEWDDSAGCEAFQNAKARYWAKVNHLPCDIPLPDPYMYIDDVNFDTFIDPELAADLERSFVNPDTNNESVYNHLDSSEHKPKPKPATGCGEAEQSFSNWDKHVEKPVPASVWDDMGVKNGWGNGILQSDSWQSRKNHSMDVNVRENSHRVSWKDQDESWRHHENWKNGQNRNSSWKHMNSRHPVDDQLNSSWNCSSRINRNSHPFEKEQPHKPWKRGQFLVDRNHQRAGYSGAQFQRGNEVS